GARDRLHGRPPGDAFSAAGFPKEKSRGADGKSQRRALGWAARPGSRWESLAGAGPALPLFPRGMATEPRVVCIVAFVFRRKRYAAGQPAVGVADAIQALSAGMGRA